MEDLDDVAILVPDESDVREVNDFLNQRGVNTQVHYRTGNVVPFRTVNTLDFSNNDLPCILTYYAAKGSEFDNVFVPFANEANTCKRNAFMWHALVLHAICISPTQESEHPFERCFKGKYS